jgi:hypothetical protein
MEYRYLGNSRFTVPALGFGAGRFGGKGPLSGAWGNTDIEKAKRLVSTCLDAGFNLVFTADVYSDGASESILGAALKGRREQGIISTKLTLRAGDGPDDLGASRHHLIPGVERTVRRSCATTLARSAGHSTTPSLPASTRPAVTPLCPHYPNWNGMFTERNPPPVPFNLPTEPQA